MLRSRLLCACGGHIVLGQAKGLFGIRVKGGPGRTAACQARSSHHPDWNCSTKATTTWRPMPPAAALSVRAPEMCSLTGKEETQNLASPGGGCAAGQRQTHTYRRRRGPGVIILGKPKWNPCSPDVTGLTKSVPRSHWKVQKGLEIRTQVSKLKVDHY